MKTNNIKSAIEMAHICGLSNLGQAISNWDRSLIHISYKDIPIKTREMKSELEIALPLLGRPECWEYSLQEINEKLELGIDFEKLDQEMFG